MTTMDYMAIGTMGVAALVSAVTFGMIANYLFDHRLADRGDTDVLGIYRKSRRHIRQATGQDSPLFRVHAAAAGVFILGGMAYFLARFVFKWTF